MVTDIFRITGNCILNALTSFWALRSLSQLCSERCCRGTPGTVLRWNIFYPKLETPLQAHVFGAITRRENHLEASKKHSYWKPGESSARKSNRSLVTIFCVSHQRGPDLC